MSETTRHKVEPNRCNCHPETCACNPFVVKTDGKKIASYFDISEAKEHVLLLEQNDLLKRQAELLEERIRILEREASGKGA